MQVAPQHATVEPRPLAGRGRRLVALETLGDGRVGPLLRGLEAGARPPSELERRLPGLERSSLAERLARLERIGALRRTVGRAPGRRVRYRLTPAGEELMGVANVLDAWAERAAYGDLVARPSDAMAKALVAGWASGLMAALAAGPARRAHLERAAPALAHHQLESRLRGLLRAGLVERLASARGGGRIALTSRGREAMGPVLAALVWDHAHAASPAPPRPHDVATAMVIGFPLVVVSRHRRGLVTLTVADPGRPGSAELVRAQAGDGRVEAHVGVAEQGELAGWAHGEIAEWGDTLVRGRRGIHVAGEPGLVTAILNALRDRLFPE